MSSNTSHASCQELAKILETYNQEHLLQYTNELTIEQKQALLDQLNQIDFKEATEMFKEAIRTLQEQENSDHMRSLEPISINEFGSSVTYEKDILDDYWLAGLQVISKGLVAALVLAGGQGTRLGYPYPKGMISINIPSRKSLFQLQIERILRLQHLADKQYNSSCTIPLYVMTSNATHQQTLYYLAENNYFGLKPDDVVLFKQAMNPCFTLEGKIIMEEKHSVALAPGGTGGLYQAMLRNQIFDDMHRRGVNYIHMYSVDNILIKVADPIFLGYFMEQKSDCAAKVVKKTRPMNVGVLCRDGATVRLVEYSELSSELAEKRDENGEYFYQSGSVCVHMFTLDFMRKMAAKKLRYHVAKKKIPYVDASGTPTKPTAPNGIKIEQFVFEAFEYAEKFVAWEIRASDEFSAIKNADRERSECPLTARRDLLQLHKKYAEKAGAHVDGEVEISPLASYAGEDLMARIGNMHVPNGTTAHVQGDDEYKKLQM